MQLRSGGWPSIIGIYAFGLIASAEIGKVVPVVQDIKSDFHVSSTTAGLAISLVALFGAVSALAMGAVINRFGDRNVLGTSAIVSMLANIICWRADSVGTLLFGRLLDGSACICFGVAGLLLLMRTTSGKRRTGALTLWATSIPLGFQGALIVAATVAGTASWRSVFWVAAVFLLAAAILSRAFPPPPENVAVDKLRTTFSIVTAPGPLRVAAAFGLMTIVRAGVNSSIPHYFAAAFKVPILWSASVTSIGSIPESLGCVCAGYLLNRGMAPRIIGVQQLVVVICGAAVMLNPAVGWQVAALGVFALQFACGGASTLLYTALPEVRGIHSGASASGFLNQVAFIALVLAAPLCFTVLDHSGWVGLLALIGALSIGSFLLTPFGALVKGAEFRA